ncbi:MAG: hypothetical protein HQM10_25125 [Candidatus Riflebacteria bacterium]|nr:hypothetical protein [Candidatus Riflebacteria bacterium]
MFIGEKLLFGKNLPELLFLENPLDFYSIFCAKFVINPRELDCTIYLLVDLVELVSAEVGRLCGTILNFRILYRPEWEFSFPPAPEQEFSKFDTKTFEFKEILCLCRDLKSRNIVPSSLDSASVMQKNHEGYPESHLSDWRLSKNRCSDFFRQPLNCWFWCLQGMT